MNPSRPGRKKVKFSPTEEESEESNGTSAQEKDVGETIVDVVDNPMHRGGEIGGKEDVPGSIYGDVGEGTGLEEVALDDDDSGNMGGRGGDEKWTETTIPVPTSLHSSLVILKTPSLHPIFIYFFHLITFLASLVGLYCFLEPSFPVKFYYFTMTWPFSFCSFMAVVMGAGSTIKADISHAKVLGILSLYRMNPHIMFNNMLLVTQLGAMVRRRVEAKQWIEVVWMLIFSCFIPLFVKWAYLQKLRMARGAAKMADEAKRKKAIEEANKKANESKIETPEMQDDATKKKNAKMTKRNFSMHSSGPRSEGAQMTYSDFENIVMQDMPKIIFSLFLACAYFSLESNACIAHVERMMPQDPTRDNILCSALPAEECTNDSDCHVGYEECEDIVKANLTFSIAFIIIAAIRIFVFPLNTNLYDDLNIARFEMAFRDQLQVILLSISCVLALFIFASSDEIDPKDWCKYQHGGSGIVNSKRTQAQRFRIDNICWLFLLLSLGTVALPHDPERITPCNIRLVPWLHENMKAHGSCEVAAVLRWALTLICSLVFCINISLVQYSSRTLKDPTSDEAKKSFQKAQNAYAASLSAWSILFAAVGLFFMSRPILADHIQRRRLFSLLPAHSLFAGISAAFLSIYQGNNGEIKTFSSNWKNQCGIFILILTYYPVIEKSMKLLRTKYSEAEAQAHLLNLSATGLNVLAPALYLFAEGAGCVTSNGFLECTVLVEINFTVQLQLILFYVYLTLFGFTLSTISLDDIVNFTAPLPVIVQCYFGMLASLLAFTVFGFRPKDTGGIAYYIAPVDNSTRTLAISMFEEGASDPTLIVSNAIRTLICALWVACYFTQGYYVFKLSRINNRGTRRLYDLKEHNSTLPKSRASAIAEGEEEEKEGGNNKTVKAVVSFRKYTRSASSRLYETKKRIKGILNRIKYHLRVKDDTNIRLSPFFEWIGISLGFLFAGCSTCATFWHHGAIQGGFWVVCCAAWDFVAVLLTLCYFSNLNKPRRRDDIFFFVLVLYPALIFSFVDGMTSLIIGILLALGCFIIMKAKHVLIRTFPPSELKSHMVKSALLVGTQLSPILFLQGEFTGCMMRAFWRSKADESLPQFNVATAATEYCVPIQQGTKAVSFHVTMMLITSISTGVFAKFSNNEVTVKRMAMLKLSKLQAIQLVLMTMISLTALYLYGNRGKSTDFYSAAEWSEEDIALRFNLKIGIYLGWTLMIGIEVLGRIYAFYTSELATDLLRQRMNEHDTFSHDPDSEERKSIPKKNRRASMVWDLKSTAKRTSTSFKNIFQTSFRTKAERKVSEADQKEILRQRKKDALLHLIPTVMRKKIMNEEDKERESSLASKLKANPTLKESERLKKIMSWKSKDNDQFDFSPGML